MTHPPSAHGHRLGCVLGAAALSVLCLLAGHPVAAQPSYRPAPGAYAPPPYYPAPPHGFRGGRPYECDLYGRDQADLYVPRGAGVGGGAVRGAVGGAVFGAIVGGSKGAKRGAVAGGGLGAVASGALRARSATSLTSSPTTTACWDFAAELGPASALPHVRTSQEIS